MSEQYAPPLFIHQDFLDCFPKLAGFLIEPETGPRSIYLDKVLRRFSSAAGHVLVHFLLTGTYKKLEETHPTDANTAFAHLCTSLLVQRAAIHFEMDDLMHLSVDEMRKQSHELHLFTVIDAVEKVCSEPLHPSVLEFVSSQLQIYTSTWTADNAQDSLALLQPVGTTTALLLKIIVEKSVSEASQSLSEINEETVNEAQLEKRARTATFQTVSTQTDNELTSDIAGEKVTNPTTKCPSPSSTRKLSSNNHQGDFPPNFKSEPHDWKFAFTFD